MEQQDYDLAVLIKSWPSPIVAREEVDKFSGGILHCRTMTNLDSKGLGPKGKFSVGRKVAYDVRLLVEWMQQRQAANKPAVKQDGGHSNA